MATRNIDIDSILAVQLDALPNLYRAAESAPDAVTQGVLRSVWASEAAGNASASVQQVFAAADKVVGFAPWQLPGLQHIAAIPTTMLASGRALLENLAAQVVAELATLAWGLIRDALTNAARAVFGAFVDLLAAFGPVGWVVELVVGFVMAIVDLVKLAKRDEAAKKAEGTVAPALPDPEHERANLKALLAKLEGGGDWTSIWLPVADPADPDYDWLRGFGCALIEPGGAFAGGRRIDILTKSAWLLEDGQGFGDRGRYGFGAMPGGGLFRTLQVNAGASTITNTGSWWPVVDGAASTAWSMLWAYGPSVFAVDAEQGRVAWSRFIAELIETIDAGRNGCDKVSVESRQRIRAHVVEYLEAQDGSPEVVAETSRPVRAMVALDQRQSVMMESTVVPYVDARNAPVRLRDRLRTEQAAMADSHLVCGVDTTAVPDPLYKGQLELRKQNRGAQCYMVQNLAASGPQFLGGKPPSEPPPATDPTRRGRSSSRPQPPRTTAPSRASGESTQSTDGGGGALLTAAVLALVIALAASKGGRRR